MPNVDIFLCFLASSKSSSLKMGCTGNISAHARDDGDNNSSCSLTAMNQTSGTVSAVSANSQAPGSRPRKRANDDASYFGPPSGSSKRPVAEAETLDQPRAKRKKVEDPVSRPERDGEPTPNLVRF